MAGFVIVLGPANNLQFHIGTPNLANIIRTFDDRRVITLQLDGDELDAALWGLENYKKGVVQ